MKAVIRPVRVFAFALFTMCASVAGAEVVDLQLVLAVDVSGSVDDEEAVLQRRGYVDALTSDAVIQAITRGRNGRIALTYVEWAGNHLAETIVDWTVIDGIESAAGFANKLLQAPVRVEMWTSISTAIDYGSAMLEFSPHTGGRRVIDISGDGANNSGGFVVTARDAAVARGITINGLPIVNDKPSRFGRRQIPNLDLYYQDCVIGGDGAFLIVANGFGDFARAIRRKMVLEIAGATPAPTARVRLAAARSRPGCDAGERRLDDFDDF